MYATLAIITKENPLPPDRQMLICESPDLIIASNQEAAGKISQKLCVFLGLTTQLDADPKKLLM